MYMRNTRLYTFLTLLFISVCFYHPVSAQSSSINKLKKEISDTLTIIANHEVWVGNVSVNSINIDNKKKTVTIVTNESLGYLPFRNQNVEEIYSAIHAVLPYQYNQYKVFCKVGQNNIEDLIPNYYRRNRIDTRRQYKHKKQGEPLVANISRPYEINKGLENRHIALWQSHGWHYDQKLARWEWQRARLLQTVEDLYTQSYVLPFLVPMLENAGAVVLLPRERDTQLHEVIVDNDMEEANSIYTEKNAEQNWERGKGNGFGNPKSFYLSGENPFTYGSYRQCKTTRNENNKSFAEWIPDIPEAGKYAVYVSYKTLPNSVEKANYTVYHKGGTTSFEVNQTMYGGTWLYLGHFDFDEGLSEKGRVVLDNYSKEKGKVVTADAVKIGGGMGNIARSPLTFETLKSRNEPLLADRNLNSASGYIPEISGCPRFTEGARYWLQWAGIPDSIYSRSKGENDYTDDFQSRGFWVNHISGGSGVSPKQKGLNVPVDLALAFHTDVGTTNNDSVIGTLAICTTRSTDRKYVYKNGTSRLAARDLTDIVQTQIVNDIRTAHASEWVRRGIWDKSYSESRVPEVPAMLLELLSHQNFADMRYGLDPRFRFTVCRAIYKGILKYFESVYGEYYVVQPLPVEQFNIRFISENEIELNWEPVDDPLEPSAKARQYVVYMQMDNTGFDNGYLINENRCRFITEPDHIYNFKVTAVNEGGESFPSETLSACRSSQNKGEVLIINGFDRISAPASFMLDSTYAGFLNKEDAGVPYISDISFTGEQYEFNRSIPWTDDDAPGFGASHGNYETMVIAGNTFDYPVLHGKAIKEAGYSFVSSGKQAVIREAVNMNDYDIVDLILGKQKETFIGNRHTAPEFKTFPLDLQEKIQDYCLNGGNIFVSGSYLASGMYHSTDTTGNDRLFVENILKCTLRNAYGSISGEVKVVQSPVPAFKKSRLSYYDRPNPVSYYVERADAIEPVDNKGFTICRYGENNLSAGIIYNTGNNKICALGFPFETIKEESERNNLMKAVLEYFTEY